MGESEKNMTMRDSLAFLLQYVLVSNYSVQSLQTVAANREMCLRLRRGNAVSIIQCSQAAKLINEEVPLTLCFLLKNRLM